MSYESLEGLEHISIRPCTSADSKIVAKLHHELQIGNIAAFGREFLTRFYEQALVSNTCELHVAHDREKIVGFFLIKTSLHFSIRNVLGIKKLILLLARSIFRPSILSSFLYLAFAPRRPSNKIMKHELIYLGVYKEYQRMGIGRMLFCSIRDRFANIGSKKFAVTVDVNDSAAIDFYLSMGGEQQEDYNIGNKRVSMLIFSST